MAAGGCISFAMWMRLESNRWPATAAALLQLLVLFPSTSSYAAAQNQPNVIFFHTDDLPWLTTWPEGPAARQDPDLSFFPRALETPHIDRVRDEGAVFQNLHVAAPICASSRFSTITGRFGSRGIRVRELSKLPPSNPKKNPPVTVAEGSGRVNVNVGYTRLYGADVNETLPHQLREAGYRTGVAGKWHLVPVDEENSILSPDAYEEAKGFAYAAGFDWAGGFYEHNMGKAWKTSDPTIPPKFSHNMEWVTAEAKDFITESHELGMPFMLYFNPTTPHSPDVFQALFDFSILETPAGTLTEVPNSGMPSREAMWQKAKAVLTPEEINEAEARKYANDTKCFDNGTPGCLGFGTRDSPATAALGTVTCDESLGALMAHLEDLGILDNTVIVVQGDHGVDAKNRLYNGGTQVLAAVRYPPLIQPATTIDTLVSNLDHGPAFLELAGKEPGYNLDGMSWVPLMSPDGQEKQARGVIFSAINYERAAFSPDNFKLISRGDLSDDGNVNKNLMVTHPASADMEQLYDLTNDPDESINLIDDPLYADVAERLRSSLKCFDEQLSLNSTEFRSNSIFENCMTAGDVGDIKVVDIIDDMSGACRHSYYLTNAVTMMAAWTLAVSIAALF